MKNLFPFLFLFVLFSCDNNRQELNSLIEQNQKIKQDITDVSSKLDSLMILMEEKEDESLPNVTMLEEELPPNTTMNTNVNLSVPKDEGLETARKYIESHNYKLDFIKGEKGKKEGNCDIYRLVFEKDYGEKVMYLALVKEDCVTTLETSSPDTWDYSMLENKNQCGCYNVGGGKGNGMGEIGRTK